MRILMEGEMPARITVLDDTGIGRKSLDVGSEFWLRDNREFRLNEWLYTLSTANATPTVMLTENATLLNNTAYAFHGLFIARYTGASTAGAYVVQGCVKRGAAAANTVMVGTALVTAYEDTAGMDLTVAADTTNGRVNFTATGVGATTINWAGRVRWVSV